MICYRFKHGEELAEIYASADIMVFPSLTETFGNTVTEALASGLVVVAYDYAAAQMHIEHEVNGLLADYGNEQQFLQKLRSGDAACIRRLAENCRPSQCQQFDVGYRRRSVWWILRASLLKLRTTWASSSQSTALFLKLLDAGKLRVTPNLFAAIAVGAVAVELGELDSVVGENARFIVGVGNVFVEVDFGLRATCDDAAKQVFLAGIGCNIGGNACRQ